MIANYNIIVCPNVTIGNTVVNYIVEVYERHLSGGVAARNGYHEYPSYKMGRKPSKTVILTEEGVERLINQYHNATVERW